MTWKVSVFPAFPVLMLKQLNQCPAFPDFFQMMGLFSATAAFTASGVNLIKINYAQNFRFIEGICISRTVMYRFWIKFEKAKINNYIRCTLAQKKLNLRVLWKPYCRGMLCWTSVLNICLNNCLISFKQSLDKEEQCSLRANFTELLWWFVFVNKDIYSWLQNNLLII